MTFLRITAVSAAAITAALILSACSGSNSSMPGMDMGGSSISGDASSASTASDHNDADVIFVQGMVPHHEQAVAMSDTLLAKGNVPDTVLQLANTIKSEQSPEIVTLNGWRAAWGAMNMSTPTSTEMNMGTGMMSQDDMDKLSAATGDEAAKLYLEQMIMHHGSAVEMAKKELTSGQNPGARALAQNIVTSQTAEIEAMQTLLAAL